MDSNETPDLESPPPAADAPAVESAPPPPLPPPQRNNNVLWLLMVPLACLGYVGLAHRPQPAATPRPVLASGLDSAWQAYRSGDSDKARQLAEAALQELQAKPSSDPRAAAEAESLLALTRPVASPTPAATASPELSPTPTPTPAVSATPEARPTASLAVNQTRPAAPEEPVQTVVRPALPTVKHPYPQGHAPVSTPTPTVEESPEPAEVETAAPTATFESKLLAATRELRRTLDQRDVEVTYVGTGLTGDVLELMLVNRKSQAVRIEYAPGMMLVPDHDVSVPSLMVSDPLTVLLAPEETRKVKLGAYALDGVALPGDGRMVDYRLKVSPTSHAIRLLKASLSVPQHPKLAPQLHRRAVMQLALWEAAHIALDDSRFQTALGLYARDGWARTSVLADVDPLLQAGR